MRAIARRSIYALLTLVLAMLTSCGGGPSGIPLVATNLATERGSHTATLLANGKVLVAGGHSASAVLASAELYTPASNTWVSGGNLATERSGHTATRLSDGRVLVAGGSASLGILASAELYDPVTNAWTPAGNLAISRTNHTATLLQNGKVLVVGGATIGHFLDSAELYDPATDTWAPAGSLSYASNNHTATLLPSGQVLVAGGYGSNISTLAMGASLARAEIYDSATNTWNAAGNTLATSRYGHTATLLPSGQVLVAGGYNTAGLGLLAALKKPLLSAELYDPINHTWSAVGNLGSMRGFHTASLLSNGKLLVIAGDASDTIGTPIALLDSAELYDPANYTWAAEANLGHKRVYHTATVLSNGRILVVGGWSVGGYTSSVELMESVF